MPTNQTTRPYSLQEAIAKFSPRWERARDSKGQLFERMPHEGGLVWQPVRTPAERKLLARIRQGENYLKSQEQNP